MKKRIKENIDLILSVLFGLFFLALCKITLYETNGPLLYLRWSVGTLFVFFIAGYPITTILYPASKSLKAMERVMLSSGFSLFLTYPAGLVNIILEGKTNVFHPHLVGVITILNVFVLFFCAISYLVRKRNNIAFIPDDKSIWAYDDLANSFKNKTNAILISILSISAFFNFYRLNRVDLNVDEWFIVKMAYDLVDGNFAARNAYCLSFHNHSPLANYVSHVTMQIINPLGLYQLNEWIIHLPCAIMGVISVFFIFVLARKMFNKQIGLIASFIVATSNYTVWSSRISLPQDSFLMPFMIISLYTLYRFVDEERRADMFSAGFFLGCTMLIKSTGILLIPVFVLYAFLKRKKLPNSSMIKMLMVSILVFMPVILFNIGAYITTGYMDVSFAKLFGVKSAMGPYIRGYPGALFAFDNLKAIFGLLLDQYSLPLFALFVSAFVGSIAYLKNSKDKENILLMWIWVFMIILFFWATGVLAWHMPFITAPFAIIAAYCIHRLMSGAAGRIKFTALLVILILALSYSMYYTYNTNINSNYTYIQEYDFQSISLSDLQKYQFSRSGRLQAESYGSKELRAYLYENYDPKNDIIVIKDDTCPHIAGWSMIAVTIDKFSPHPYEYSEIKGIKDLNYLPKLLVNSGRLCIGADASPEIVLLSALTAEDLKGHEDIIVIIPSARFSDPSLINESRKTVLEERIDMIKDRYTPTKVIYDAEGHTTFYIYTIKNGDMPSTVGMSSSGTPVARLA